MRDLNDFRFFAAVVDAGGFSSAARKLGVPKSRLSRRLALLEEELGVRLLERSTRRQQVTTIGREVYAQAVAMTEAANAAVDRALRARAEPQGRVRMSCPINLHDALTRRLPDFLTAHPRLQLQILSTNRRVDLVEDLVDVAVRVRDRLDTDVDLHMRRIGVSRRVVVASPHLVEQYGAPMRPQDLAPWPLLDSGEGAGRSVWRLTGPRDQALSLEFEPRLAVGDFAALAEAATAGLGAALLPILMVRPSLQSGRLVQLLGEWGAPEGVVHLIFTSRRSMLPSVRAVIDFAAEALKDVAE